MTELAIPPKRPRPPSFAALPHLFAVFAGFAVLSLTVLGPWMTYKPEPYTGEGSPLRQICYFAVFPLAIAACRPLLKPMRLAAVPPLLIIALLWCWASLAWAIEPGIALRRLILTTIVIWTIFLAVEELSYAEMMRLIRIALALTLVANYVAVILFPHFGIHQLDVELDRSGEDPGLVGDWRGIMLQKNFAGATCAFTILTYILDARRIKFWFRILIIAASLFFLVKSGSKTSMGIVLLGLVAAGIYIRYNPAYRLLLIPAMMIFLGALYIYIDVHWSALIAPLYDQGAFTGRTQIWPPLIAFFQEHPALGAGYGSFWNIGLGESPIYAYAKGWVVHITQGHDGYLDLLVTIGLPGLLLVVTAVILAPIARLLASQTVPRQTGALLLAMVIFCAGHNFTESSLFDRDAIIQTFLMFTVALTYKVTRTPSSSRALVRATRFQKRVLAHE